MKTFVYAILHMAVLLGNFILWAQEVPTTTAPKSNYDYHDAFAPFFIQKWNNNTVRKRSTGCRILAK
jgi:hypothetical protein